MDGFEFLYLISKLVIPRALSKKNLVVVSCEERQLQYDLFFEGC